MRSATMCVDEASSIHTERNGVMNAAIGLLARRDYSRSELTQKLAPRCASPELLEDILDALVEQGLQSDERFCEAFIRYRISQGKGPAKIRQDLLLKGISASLIAACLTSDSEYWFAQAQELYQRKYQGAPVSDVNEKARRLRFMVSRGFSASLVYGLIDCSI